MDWQDNWAGPLFLQARHERALIRAQVEKSIVLWAYETNTKRTDPVLHEIFGLANARTRKEMCLIRVARHWNEMNNEVACPINFTREEMKIHYLEGEGWNDQADFWDALRGFVERDGWTSNEDYKRALETFAELREPGLQDLIGDERLHF
ncbi:hypothetical protein V8F44DRAFT_666147 [Aspergillus fumigatus]